MDYSMDAQLELIMKAVTVGDTSSGKTTLCFCLRHGEKPPVARQATVGVDFCVLEWKLDQRDTNKLTKIQLFDTAGMEKFRAIAESYFRSANIFLIVADTTKELGKHWEDRWIKRSQEVQPHPDGFPRKTILVATKIDQLPEHDLNHNENIKKLKLLANTHGFYFIMTTIDRVPNMVQDFYTVLVDIWAAFLKHHEQIKEKEEQDRPKTLTLKPRTDEVDGWALEHRCQC